MDMELMLNEFKKAKPSRHIIFMDGRSKEEYYEEYIAFNIDILKRFLPETRLTSQFFDGGVAIKCEGMDTAELLHTLLFDCAILGLAQEGFNGAYLMASISVCDMMSAVCRLLSKFEK